MSCGGVFGRYLDGYGRVPRVASCTSYPRRRLATFFAYHALLASWTPLYVLHSSYNHAADVCSRASWIRRSVWACPLQQTCASINARLLAVVCLFDKWGAVLRNFLVASCCLRSVLLLSNYRVVTYGFCSLITRGCDEHETTGTAAAVARAGFHLRSHAAATAKRGGCAWGLRAVQFVAGCVSYKVVRVKSPQRPPKRGHAHTSSAAAVEGDTRVASLINDPLAFHGCVYEFSACCGRCVQRNRSSRQSVTDRRKSFSSSNS